MASPLLAPPSFGEMDIYICIIKLVTLVSVLAVVGWLMESIMVPNFEFLWHFSRQSIREERRIGRNGNAD